MRKLPPQVVGTKSLEPEWLRSGNNHDGDDDGDDDGAYDDDNDDDDADDYDDDGDDVATADGYVPHGSDAACDDHAITAYRLGPHAKKMRATTIMTLVEHIQLRSLLTDLATPNAMPVTRKAEMP